MFSRRIPLVDLIDFCRILRHQLGAGLSIHQVFRKQGENGRRSYSAIAGRISDQVQAGNSLSSAIDEEKEAFPLLFRSLVKLGDATGHSAEMFGELERYYQLELQLRRQFRSQTFVPILQFVLAVAIIAGLIFLLGVIDPQKPLLTIFGLGGAAGALAFLGVVAGSLGSLWLVYAVIRRLGRRRVWMDRVLLSVPALGPCLRALMMSRFTLALQLTLDTGLSITKALRLSLESTSNAYFASHADGIVRDLKDGNSLHEALEASGFLPSDFLDMVATSEASGSVPEMMRQLAQQYQEETTRRMTFLTRFAGGFVWCCVAGFMIWAIFTIFFSYLNMLGGIGKR